MNAMLGVLLALAIFVTFCYAYCTIHLLEFLPGSQPTGCLDLKGLFHELNTHWEADCMSCTCAKIGILCCSMVLKPVAYDQEECIEIFNKDSCLYSVVKKNEPDMPCEVSAYVG